MSLVILHKRRLTGNDWTHALSTRSNASNWCFHRFRIMNSAGVTVQARKPDGTIIDTQPFHSGGGWTTGTYEHDFMFDLSFNTAKDQIEIYIKGVTSKFYQLYSVYAHAGSAVRWQDDPAASGMTNGEISYINIDFLKFDGGTNDTRFLYLEDNGVEVIEGGRSVSARSIDIHNNPALTSDMVDDIIIGADNSGVQPSNANGQACYLVLTEGTRTAASDVAWQNLIDKGWTLQFKT